MRERLRSKYFKLGLTMFLAGAAIIIFYHMIADFTEVKEIFSTINLVLSPFIFGLVTAYLLCPLYNLVVRNVYKWTSKKIRTKRKALSFARVIATIASITVLFGTVGGLFALVLPELVRSIIGLIQVMPDRLNDLLDWGRNTFTAEKFPQAAAAFEGIIEKVINSVTEWAENEFLPNVGIFMSHVSQGVLITLRTVLNSLIGVIICIYFLNSKERFKAQIRKLVNAFNNKERADDIFEFAYYANDTFGGFINGKLIDSLIMGILCFIAMSIIGLPYTVLVSTIVGVTNFIPFFGPFIGAIPSAIIICLVSPVQAIYFLIMILVLQQIDGNIIGPRILGDSIGIASFWVMFAIIVGGGFFGFAGMVLGVPVFAIIYYYFGKFIKKRLRRKNMPTETTEYEEFNKYNIDRRDVL